MGKVHLAVDGLRTYTNTARAIPAWHSKYRACHTGVAFQIPRVPHTGLGVPIPGLGFHIPGLASLYRALGLHIPAFRVTHTELIAQYGGGGVCTLDFFPGTNKTFKN